MANRTLNTRIKLRYDSYQNWYDKNPELLVGELAIAYIESGDTQEVNSVAAPQVLFKVGPGYFNDLPWASGKAADVYSWAKAAVKPSYTKAEVGLGNVRDVEQYSKDEVDELVEGIREDLETDTNTTYRFATEKNKIVFYSTEKGGSESQVAAFEVDLSDVENAISNCYTKNEIDNKGFLVASDIAGKAEKTYVDEELAKKANLTYVNEELAKKADKTDLDNYYNKESIDGVVNGLDQRITTNANAIEALTNGTSTEEIDSVMELVKYVNEHGTEVTGIKADIKANADAIDAIEAKPAMEITSQNIIDWNDAVSKEHIHENKDVLDGISSTKVAAWDASEKNAKDYADGLVSPVSEKVTTLESGLATEKGRIDTIAADYLTSEDKTNLENGLGGLIEDEKERAEGEELKLSNRIKNVEDNYLSKDDVIIWDCGGAN